MSEVEPEHRAKTTLQDMVVRGKDYREDYEFELYGEEITVVIKPLIDEQFLPIMSSLSETLDVEEADADKAVEEVEDAGDEQEIDTSQLSDGFVAEMQKAATLGIVGGYTEDEEYIEYSDEEIMQLVGDMMGGYSVELGSRVLELSGSVRDAEKFP